MPSSNNVEFQQVCETATSDVSVANNSQVSHHATNDLGTRQAFEKQYGIPMAVFEDASADNDGNDDDLVEITESQFGDRQPLSPVSRNFSKAAPIQRLQNTFGAPSPFPKKDNESKHALHDVEDQEQVEPVGAKYLKIQDGSRVQQMPPLIKGPQPARPIKSATSRFPQPPKILPPPRTQGVAPPTNGISKGPAQYKGPVVRPRFLYWKALAAVITPDGRQQILNATQRMNIPPPLPYLAPPIRYTGGEPIPGIVNMLPPIGILEKLQEPAGRRPRKQAGNALRKQAVAAAGQKRKQDDIEPVEVKEPGPKKARTAAQEQSQPTVVQQPLQRPVQQAARQSLAQPLPQSVRRPVQQRPQQPLQQALPQPLQRPVQQPSQRPAGKPLQRPVQQSLQRPVQRPLQRPLQQSVQHIQQLPQSTVVKQPQSQSFPSPYLEFTDLVGNDFDKVFAEYEFEAPIVPDATNKIVDAPISAGQKVNHNEIEKAAEYGIEALVGSEVINNTVNTSASDLAPIVSYLINDAVKAPSSAGQKRKHVEVEELPDTSQKRQRSNLPPVKEPIELPFEVPVGLPVELPSQEEVDRTFKFEDIVDPALCLNSEVLPVELPFELPTEIPSQEEVDRAFSFEGIIDPALFLNSEDLPVESIPNLGAQTAVDSSSLNMPAESTQANDATYTDAIHYVQQQTDDQLGNEVIATNPAFPVQNEFLLNNDVLNAFDPSLAFDLDQSFPLNPTPFTNPTTSAAFQGSQNDTLLGTPDKPTDLLDIFGAI